MVKINPFITSSYMSQNKIVKSLIPLYYYVYSLFVIEINY